MVDRASVDLPLKSAAEFFFFSDQPHVGFGINLQSRESNDLAARFVGHRDFFNSRIKLQNAV